MSSPSPTPENFDREVFVWEGGMFPFGGLNGEAQSIGVRLAISFVLEGVVVREVIDANNGKVIEATQVSTDTEFIRFKPLIVTSVHPSTTAIEGNLSMHNATFKRPDIESATVVMMVSEATDSQRETGRIELPAV